MKNCICFLLEKLSEEIWNTFLHVCDLDKSKTLQLDELYQTKCKDLEFNIYGISEDTIEAKFKLVDVDDNRAIDFEEAIAAMKGAADRFCDPQSCPGT